MMNYFTRVFVLSLSTSIVVGCMAPTAPPVPTDTPSPVPSSTFEPTPTPEPSSTPELAASPTTSSNILTGQHSFVSEKAGRSYLLFLPATYGQDPGQKWPLILFLHGAGTRSTNIDVIKYEALPQNLEFTPDFPFIVLSPQLTNADDEDFWTREKAEESVFTLLDEVQSAYSVDPKRVYLTGVSLGANGTWEYGLRHPGRFAALVPVMGFIGYPNDFRIPENMCDLKDTPVWAFHGAKDPIVPLAAEQGLVDALEACGGNVRFTVYPEGDHDISGQAYRDPDLLTWLAAQALK